MKLISYSLVLIFAFTLLYWIGAAWVLSVDTFEDWGAGDWSILLGLTTTIVGIGIVALVSALTLEVINN